MERSASSAGVPFRGLFLTADLATRVARVGTRERDASDADAAVARSAGKLRPRRARLDAGRCLRHAGGDARAGACRNRAVRRYCRHADGMTRLAIIARNMDGRAPSQARRAREIG